MSELVEKFEEEEIDLKYILSLTEENFRELKIEMKLSLKKMMVIKDAVKELINQNKVHEEQTTEDEQALSEHHLEEIEQFVEQFDVHCAEQGDSSITNSEITSNKTTGPQLNESVNFVEHRNHRNHRKNFI